jgi:hypothetical protein
MEGQQEHNRQDAALACEMDLSTLAQLQADSLALAAEQQQEEEISEVLEYMDAHGITTGTLTDAENADLCRLAAHEEAEMRDAIAKLNQPVQDHLVVPVLDPDDYDLANARELFHGAYGVVFAVRALRGPCKGREVAMKVGPVLSGLLSFH